MVSNEEFVQELEAIRSTQTRWLTGPNKIRRSIRKWAYWIFSDALKEGIIKRPLACENCGSINKTLNGHHESYYEPIKVDWLCPKCHLARHNEIKNDHLD